VKDCLDIIFEHDNMGYLKNLTQNSVDFFAKNIENFKIVQYENGNDLNWYLLYKRKMIICKWFGLEYVYYKPICGYDLGRDGLYSHELCCTANPVVLLIRTIPDFLRADLGNRQIKSRTRGRLPNGKEIRELDIINTIKKVSETIKANGVNKSLFDVFLENCVYLNSNCDENETKLERIR
jgi:hypothetical protein